MFLSMVVASAADPLPSWNDTAPKKAIVAFVERVTKEGGPEFVPPAERIAVFDNDGTLWVEQPMYEGRLEYNFPRQMNSNIGARDLSSVAPRTKSDKSPTAIYDNWRLAAPNA